MNKGIDDQGKTPLRIAAEQGRSEILEYLLANGAKTNLGDERFGPFNLNIGSESDGEMLKKLKVLSKFKIDIRHCELLDTAAYRGYIQSAEYLLENGCPVETWRPDGKTLDIHPLWECVSGNRENVLEMIDLLVSHGASINTYKRYGFLPLRTAVEYSEPAVVEKLILCGADVNLHREGERTLFCKALYRKPKTKALKIIKLLVEHGADTHIKNEGRSARQLAAYNDLDNVVAYFKEQGIK